MKVVQTHLVWCYSPTCQPWGPHPTIYLVEYLIFKYFSNRQIVIYKILYSLMQGQSIQTIVFIIIFIFIMFRLMRPSAFFLCFMSNSEETKKDVTESFASLLIKLWIGELTRETVQLCAVSTWWLKLVTGMLKKWKWIIHQTPPKCKKLVKHSVAILFFRL